MCRNRNDLSEITAQPISVSAARSCLVVGVDTVSLKRFHIVLKQRDVETSRII
ncbi:hypothetical protein SAMN04488527_12717 [Aliiroseovarius crassostreae]|nr:hypothetical protein SAMN04488527_12717 [Aliiroseovarius crassostreae]